jgi:PAS domain S-box-containing protein
MINDTAYDVEPATKLSLEESEIRYRRLFEAAQDGILILDAKTGMIEDVNPYLIKMLGYSRKENFGMWVHLKISTPVWKLSRFCKRRNTSGIKTCH